MKKLLYVAALVALCIFSRASAGPILTYTLTNLGGGQFAFDISVDANDGQFKSIFVDGTVANTGLLFDGPVNGSINQILAFAAVPVNKESDANLYQSLYPGSGYQKNIDSWFKSPWTENTQGVGIAQGANSYKIAAGTGSLSTLLVAPLAHIVVNGPYVNNVGLTYVGVVQRDGNTYPVSGTLLVPEPSTLALILLGVIGLLATRTVRSRRR